MNNLQMAKDFTEGCDTITSLFVGLGKQDKLYSLYANWKETVWGNADGQFGEVDISAQIERIEDDYKKLKEKIRNQFAETSNGKE